MLVPEGDLLETDVSAREGLRTVVTTGTGQKPEQSLLDDDQFPE